MHQNTKESIEYDIFKTKQNESLPNNFLPEISKLLPLISPQNRNSTIFHKSQIKENISIKSQKENLMGTNNKLKGFVEYYLDNYR